MSDSESSSSSEDQSESKQESSSHGISKQSQRMPPEEVKKPEFVSVQTKSRRRPGDARMVEISEDLDDENVVSYQDSKLYGNRGEVTTAPICKPEEEEKLKRLTTNQRLLQQLMDSNIEDNIVDNHYQNGDSDVGGQMEVGPNQLDSNNRLLDEEEKDGKEKESENGVKVSESSYEEIIKVKKGLKGTNLMLT